MPLCDPLFDSPVFTIGGKRKGFDPLFLQRVAAGLPSMGPCIQICKEHPMDVRISPLSSQSLSSTAGLQMKRPASSGAAGGAGGVAGGFADNFKSALKSVSASQNEASRLQNEVQLGNPKVSLEETMLAMQKAQIGFQTTLNVRNRMVQAYSDIMNMSV
jgi:flagellar hook-basal body complex protein FliE